MDRDNMKNNITYLEESKYIIENRQNIIKRKKRKRLFIKLFFLSSLLIVILISLLFNLPCFSIKDIVIINNSNVSKKEIIELSKIKIGNNIFNLNKDETKNNIISNPYILKVNIQRKLPNKIVIDITERKAAFYVKEGQEYYVVDKDSVVLEKKNNINNMNLIKLLGYDNNDLHIGQVLPFKDNRKINVIREVTELLVNDTSKVKMSILDVSKVYNLKAYYGNICVKLGTQEDLKNKLNKSIAIIKHKNLFNKKGYIDVSFKGNPVFRIEN